MFEYGVVSFWNTYPSKKNILSCFTFYLKVHMPHIQAKYTLFKMQTIIERLPSDFQNMIQLFFYFIKNCRSI